MDSSGNIKNIVIGAAGVLAAVLAVGYLLSSAARSSQTQATQAMTNFQQRQMDMMQQAMTMAHQAQDAQRQHMQMIEREMHQGEEGDQSMLSGAGEDR